MLAKHSFIFLCKPCICHTESSEVKQLKPPCHSAHLFWDQSWHAGTVQLLALQAQLGLGAPDSAVSGAWHGPAAPSGHGVSPSPSLCRASPGAVTAGTTSSIKWHCSLCETSFSQYFQFSLVCPVLFLELITISAFLQTLVSKSDFSWLQCVRTLYHKLFNLSFGFTFSFWVSDFLAWETFLLIMNFSLCWSFV